MISKCVRKNKNGTARVAERQMRKPLSGKPLPFIIQVIKLMGFYKGLLRHFTDLVNWALWIDVDLLWFCVCENMRNASYCLTSVFRAEAWSHLNHLHHNISMHILHTLLYTFLWHWQGECALSSKAFLSSDHFLYSLDLNVWFSSETVWKSLRLVTLWS